MRFAAHILILLTLLQSNSGIAQKDSLRLIENYVDSMHIGRPRHNKVELFVYENTDTSFVILRFYSLSRGHWTLRQQLSFPRLDLASPDPHYADFNNDGCKDLTYISELGTRGANEIRKLFIYDKVGDRLRYIVNSADYPNLYYNKKLNCINAWLIHGGTSTAFLRLEGRRLRKFAGVDLYGDGSLDVYTVDSYGHEKTIRHEAHYHDPDRSSPFRDFNPLERDIAPW